jgi:hypothetical protein
MDTLDAMPPESLTARELARRLISREPGDENDPSSAAESARHACECMSAELSRWVGIGGYEALISRALSETRTTHPALEQVRFEARSDLRLTGVAESIARHGAGNAARGLAALLETVLTVLTRLIGADIVTMLAERSMDNCTHGDPSLRRSLDQGSNTP